MQEIVLSDTSRVIAGVVLITIVTIEFGGFFLLRIASRENSFTPFQKAFFRAGHAHAGVLVTLGLVCLVLADATALEGTIGWVARGKRPRMVSVQAENCAPIVRAYQQGKEKADPWENATTVADGLRVPRAIADFLILRAVRESKGTALAVTDEDMVRDMVDIGRLEGVSAAPEGGAALAAIRQLVADGSIKPHQTVVLFNTGGALKYLDVLKT